MRKNSFVLSALALFALSSGVMAAQEPAALTSGEVTIYTQPDHSYTDLVSYSDHIVYDLPYAGDSSTGSQILHLVFPADDVLRDEKSPLLVFIHGGSFTSGNSDEHKIAYTGEAALQALERGYVCAFVDYTLASPDGGEAALPRQIEECKAAVRYLRAISEKYNLDPEHIAVMGEDAGGFLACLMGATSGEAAYENEALGSSAFSSDVQAVIAQYPVTRLTKDICETFPQIAGTYAEGEMTEAIRYADPYSHVDGNEPPFFLEAGLEDMTVSYMQSCDLFDAVIMENEGSDSELHLIPGMDHAVTWFQTRENSTLYLKWLDRIFER